MRSFILFLFLGRILSDQFILEIPKDDMNCIGEFLSHNSHTIVSVHTKKEPLSFTLSISSDEGEGKMINSSLDVKKGLHSLNYNFNPFNSSNYQFCIKNTGEYKGSFVFNLAEGIDAKNYNETFGKKNWTEIDLKSRQIYDQVRMLKDKFRELEKANDKRFDVVSDIDFKIIIIGITSLAVIFVLGCLQLQIMIKFFKHKKLI